jgi:ABC-type branched-subunit amino acid transport system ATPase component
LISTLLLVRSLRHWLEWRLRNDDVAQYFRLPVRAGKITIAGHDFTGATPAQVLSAGVAHVPEGRRLFSVMSVEDNLRMGAHMRSDETEIRRDLAQIYELFPILGDRRRQEAGTLSGGEQTDVRDRPGIMSRPKLLMIDELPRSCTESRRTTQRSAGTDSTRKRARDPAC